ncbi:hypothetical protein BSL78_22671 [Apostichopus japonicus]|uniref:Reverse transcriptase domain-containing protein n=1 Tax=Stichopus japonicus TaxID=307972 RepID=A0A2G8JXH6_STIJA|nr:hypothetical protein BSL78_22671 [Apostichopus japonicus]
MDEEGVVPCRLINPAKSEMGKVSKVILDNINQEIRNAIEVNQWRSTSTVIKWFKSLKDKHHRTFMIFDIVDFYPSITEKLLTDALNWAKTYVSIPAIDHTVIMHARKSILFNDANPWTKKDSKNSFDVTMGSHDGAEVCELVGLFILHNLKQHLNPADVGLYRDDGLAALRTRSGRLADMKRKEVTQLFNKFGLKVTIETNLQVVNYLDITMNLANGSFAPYRKPGDNPLFIHSHSDHPPGIIKNIPQP